MDRRLAAAEVAMLVLGELAVLAGGAGGLVGPNWELAGLLAGVMATAIGWILWRSGSPLGWPACGAAVGLTLSQGWVLATGWGDEELIDPLVVLGALGLMAGALLGVTAAALVGVGRRSSRSASS